MFKLPPPVKQARCSSVRPRNILCLLGLWVLLMPILLRANPVSNIDSLKSVLAASTADSVKARTLVALASQLRYSNTSEALMYANQALPIIKEMHSMEREAVVLQILGLIYIRRNDFKQAVLYTLQALKIYETINNAEGKANALNSLGTIYLTLRKYDMAKKYYLQALSYVQKAGLEKKLDMLYCNLGNVLFDQEKFVESIIYYRKALEYSIKFKDNYSTGLNLLNVGMSYDQIGKSDSARIYFHRAISNSNLHAEQYEEIMGNAYLALGILELSEKKLGRATTYLLQAKEMAEPGSNKVLLVDIYKQLAELYKARKHYDAAFTYSMLYNAMKDSIFNETTVQQLNEMQKTYEVEKRDKEIQLLNKDKEMTESKTRTTRILFIVAFVFVFVLVIIVTRNIVLKHKIKNRILNEEKAVIEKDNAKLLQENTEAKYETLKSKINPHFLFNSLNTLSFLIKEEHWVALKYIDHFSDLYRLILETGEFELISLENEIKIVENYLYLQKMECGDNLLLEVNIPEYLYEYRLPPLALQMAVENAIKHNIITVKNKLSIFMHIKDDMVVVENNLQRKNSDPVSMKIGQKNIAARYRLISNIEPLFIETKTAYTVYLPLFASTQHKKIVTQS